MTKALLSTQVSQLTMRRLAKAVPTVAAASRNLSIKATIPTDTSVDAAEIERFGRTAAQWWNPNGPYSLLHRMNPVRIQYVRDMLSSNAALHPTLASPHAPLAGLRILDIGCGGGFLSESLARLGATVVGADATEENIKVAQAHLRTDPSLLNKRGPGSIEYMHTTAEALVKDGHEFDSVVALEIIEHVSHPKQFVETCAKLVKPEGMLFFSTINRTPASYLFTILLAEHLLRWVPQGTHSHEKYIAPEELEIFLKAASCSVLDITGMGYNPGSKSWSLLPHSQIGSLEMNYIVAARKSFV
eukprot:jgi/Hompol1/6905/HPOL_002772-RA